MKNSDQPWLFSRAFDLAFILAPAFVISAVVLLFHNHFEALKTIPAWLWLLLVVGVDVSHVYSTLFRTYLDREELRQRSGLYTLAPLLAWIVGCLLYRIDGMLFWRVLAYLAVFHFVRQQYGFMMLYGRQERDVPSYYRSLDKAAIYLATLYPLIYWHTHPRDFNWFIEGDFLQTNMPFIASIAGLVYLAVLVVYVFKEMKLWQRTKRFNLPRNLLLMGTATSWFVGIVTFNDDIAFSSTNILAHGIPYLALIWLYGRNRRDARAGKPSPFAAAWIGTLFSAKALPLYLGVLIALAFLEEGLWDGFIWGDHASLFQFSNAIPLAQAEHTLIWLVPLLALPQATHYILDAFIWRLKSKDTQWKETLFFHVTKNHD